MDINIPDLPEPAEIRRAIEAKKAEIGQLKRLLPLAELQHLCRQGKADIQELQPSRSHKQRSREVSR